MLKESKLRLFSAFFRALSRHSFNFSTFDTELITLTLGMFRMEEPTSVVGAATCVVDWSSSAAGPWSSTMIELSDTMGIHISSSSTMSENLLCESSSTDSQSMTNTDSGGFFCSGGGGRGVRRLL